MGLKKTRAALDEELPRTQQSISSRDELRAALHLDFLYKENKLADKPLKTYLEIMTKHFLDKKTLTMEGKQTAECAKLFTPQGHQRKAAVSSNLAVYDLSDEESGSSCAVSETSHILSHKVEDSPASSQKHVYLRASGDGSKKTDSSMKSSSFSLEDELKNTKENNCETTKISYTLNEPKSAAPENGRPKSSKIVRGMMSGPISSFQEDSLKKRPQRRPSATSPSSQTKNDPQKNEIIGKTEEPLSDGASNPALQLGKEFSAKLLGSAPSRNPAVSSIIKQDKQPRNGPDTADSARDAYNNFKLKFALEAEQEKLQRPQRKSEPSKRKTTRSSLNDKGSHMDDIKLDDVEEDLLAADAIGIPEVIARNKVQAEGRPIDLQQAVELKNLLFGSPLRCFSEEWKIQSFTFCNIEDLKYGFVQKKGGACGVLAAVQACLLQNLLFGRDSDIRWALHPSDTVRTRCLYRAIADILWRAGDCRQAVVSLSSGRQQFTPAGKYKADGILESLILYSFKKYDDLLTFLQQNINQFERGPFGCILLTVSSVFSRSIDLVQSDFDVPTNCLIGAHAYCTQELVNLILGGRAVSNVFNDIMELDSGNGNTTVLKGVSSRSDIGFLSLFEHYSVCQVGSYLKTPKYPIWVVCSESHFSVLFCLKKDLVSDWRAERKFDLYYYDGLANQQEEIRLTIDTSGNYVEDEDNELVPPLEFCIRTKWKGAVVDWNGTDPIL
ncbi:probable ubiquitin carboxyl-terminal hydrolase MINDY-4 isoform X2 [Rana temporaria]|uniref:probable ubiquitin carboxyl-terminal hydrolase MINDY-4 isoform X2 n=1 Tax=Rana temporaria TaxID=8407 RepID=UPI001AAD4D35|nr:probable ubiquitin carboxyl-terminal hydrolase MINDY-4 isoform X2 [Rana temporaria]